MDYLLTLLIPLALAVCVLYGNKGTGNQNAFMDKDFTRVLKGACCIIVILVHIPLAYQNKLQDGIGSFAYICVTLFFLMSAYGMSLSAERKPNYMKSFWRNRLAALLVPQLALNVFVVLANMAQEGKITLISLASIDSYVLVLLQYCLWFYLVMLGRRFYGKNVANILLSAGVVISSVVSYFCFGKSGWCYERLGLVWGLALLLYMPEVKKIVKPKAWKIITLGIVCLTLGAAYLKFKPVFFYGEYLLKIVLGLAIITLVFMLSSQRKFGNKTINFLGDISYEVYLSHRFIMHSLATLAPNLPSGVFILSTVVLTIVFSALLHSISKSVVTMLRKQV